MRLVQDVLVEIAKEGGIPFGEYVSVWLDDHIKPSLPQRYRDLVAEVVLRLPAAWDENFVWDITVGFRKGTPCYGSALRVEEEEGDEPGSIQIWEVKLYPVLLDRLTDAACQWVIAHEFGHVASGLACGSIDNLGGKPFTRVKGAADLYIATPPTEEQENAANSIALGWGFESHHRAFLAEDLSK